MLPPRNRNQALTIYRRLFGGRTALAQQAVQPYIEAIRDLACLVVSALAGPFPKNSQKSGYEAHANGLRGA
jgi:hypothetical protein